MRLKSLILYPIGLSLVLFILLQSRTPLYSGVVKISRPEYGNLTIYRDEHAVPHIKGDTLKSTLYGLGWSVAQDRLFSIETKRRLVTGTMSEVFGTETLEIDLFMRNVGIPQAAKESVEMLTPFAREHIQAYCDGINDFVKQTLMLPFEFWLLGITFEDYTPYHAMAYHKFLNFALSMDWITEIIRSRLAEEVGVEKALRWFTLKNVFEETLTVTDEELKRLGLYDEQFKKQYEKLNYSNVKVRISEAYKKDPRRFTEIDYEDGGVDSLLWKEIINIAASKGSNAWVIHGNLTDTGKPITANDPHLPNSIPSFWYLSEHIWGDNNTFVGAHTPGYPGPSVFITRFLSAGLTTLYGDNTDCYEEEISADGKEYLYEGNWWPLKEREEVINVRFGSPRKYTIKSTRHGPIIHNFSHRKIEVLLHSHFSPRNFSIAWTGRIVNDTNFDGLYGMLLAKSLQETKEASYLATVSMNLLLTTIEGDIYYGGIGVYALRGHFENEALVKDGTKAHDDWIGTVSTKNLTHLENPKNGYFASSNNKIASDAHKHGYWLNMYSTSRGMRVEELIKEYTANGRKITLEDCKKMQLDVIDPYVRDTLPGLIQVMHRYKHEIARDRRAQGIDIAIIDEMLADLTGWDASFDVNSFPATIWSAWEYLYHTKLFHNMRFSEVERIGFAGSFIMEQYHFAMFKEWAQNKTDGIDDLLCKIHDAETPRPSCIYILLQALTETKAHLEAKFGKDKRNWVWGHMHKMHYQHVPFSKTPLSIFFDRLVPAGGNKRTVNLGYYLEDAHNYNGLFSPNLRYVRYNDWTMEGYYNIDTGESENIFSPHYDDLGEMFRRGEYMKIPNGTADFPLYKNKLQLVNS